MCIERPRVLRRLIKHSSSRKMFTDGEPELVGLEGRPVPGMKAGCWGQDGWSCGCPKVSKRKGGSGNCSAFCLQCGEDRLPPCAIAAGTAGRREEGQGLAVPWKWGEMHSSGHPETFPACSGPAVLEEMGWPGTIQCWAGPQAGVGCPPQKDARGVQTAGVPRVVQPP